VIGNVAGKVARNSIGLLAASGASMVAGMVSLPFLYGRLGDVRYGIWTLLVGMVALLTVARMGLRPTMTREVARAAGEPGHLRQARGVLAIGMFWGTGLGIVMIALAALCWPWLATLFQVGEFSGPARYTALLMLLAFLIDGLVMPWQSVLEGTQHYAPVSWLTAGTAAATAVLSIAVVEYGGGLVPLAVATVLISIVRAALMMRVAARRAPALMPRPRDIRRSDLRDMTGYGLRVQTVEIAYLVNAHADRVVLGGFFGPAVVAGFEPGSKLITLLRTPVTVVMAAVFPAVVGFVERSAADRVFRAYLLMTRYLAAVAAVSTSVLLASADPLVRLWLGHPVPLAVDTIMLLAAGHGVNVCAGAVAVITMTDGRPALLARYAVLGTVVNLLLTVPLLMVFGPPGVPLATALSLVLSTGYLFARFHRDLDRPVRPLVRALGPPVLAVAAAVTLTRLVRPYLPDGPGRADAAAAMGAQGGLAVVVTLAVLAVFGFASAADRMRLRSVLRGTPASGRQTVHDNPVEKIE
jgi:O-antigen/teichoic acid export membrane protein